MHICYLADARSPIAKNWITNFVRAGHRVSIISSYACRPDEIAGATVIELPLTLTRISQVSSTSSPLMRLALARRFMEEVKTGQLAAMSGQFRNWLLAKKVSEYAERASAIIEALKPDLLHALRIPFEGFIAAASSYSGPLIVSAWGNDFTLFARSSARLAALTAKTLQRADGLFSDCQRDLALAREYDYPRHRPVLVVPGSGGLDLSVFERRSDACDWHSQLSIPKHSPIVINARGFRTYVRQDVFFRSIPHVLQKLPQATFVAVGMRGHALAEAWVRKLRIRDSVRLLPVLDQAELAGLFLEADVSVSPSYHDGSPNTLLEAMAAGCFPIAGRVDSIGEWITDGYNGSICAESDPRSIARAIVNALNDTELRKRAAKFNRDLVRERANRSTIVPQVEDFYSALVPVEAAAQQF